MPKIEDYLAERVGFELTVPICEQSYDSIRLSFATRDELQSAIALQRMATAREQDSP